jgi:SAM-dependent methyltransferase
LKFPSDLTGKSVLDVGSASGWNSFEAEKRGASVTALDYIEYAEFVAAKQSFHSQIDYIIDEVDNIDPERIGRFDFTLFLGVLYHLRHPLLGLERICSVTLESAFIESYVTDSSNKPSDVSSMNFYEIDELGGQIDNWWGPTTKCLLAMCRSAGFVRVNLLYNIDGRAGVIAHRKWEDVAVSSSVKAPFLVSAVNNRDHKKAFCVGKDEYLCLYFRFDGELLREDVQIEVSQFAAEALVLVRHSPSEWQANTRVPPGLPVGIHKVKIRKIAGPYSRAVEISIHNQSTRSCVPSMERANRPPKSFSPSLKSRFDIDMYRVVNSYDSSNEFIGRKSERLSVYFRVEQKDLDETNVFVYCDDKPLEEIVLNNIGDGDWQVNGIRQTKHR